MKKLFLLFSVLLSTIAQADFYSTLSKYSAGEYSAAYQEFMELAIIGEKQSQFNIGVMYFYGQHVSKDINKAYAWIKLANDSELTTDVQQDALRRIESQIKEKSVAESEYQQLVQKYSTEALLQKLYPQITKNISDDDFSAEPINMVKPRYPLIAAKKGIEGWIDIKFDIDENGKPRNIRLLESFPDKIFVKETFKVIPKWTFRTMLNPSNHPVIQEDMNYTLQFLLRKDSLGLKLKHGVIETTKKKVNDGDPIAQFNYALWKTKGFLKKDDFNPNELFLKSAVQGHPIAQYHVGFNLVNGRGCIKEKSKGIEWLTRSASVGQADSMELLAIIASKNDDLESQKEAVQYFKQIRELSTTAKLHYAWLLSSSIHNSIADPKNAIELVNSFSPKEFRDDTTIYEIKAASYAKMGKYEKAINYQEKALDEAEDYGFYLKTIQKNLAAYKNHENYRS